MAGQGFSPGARLWISLCFVSVEHAEAGFEGYESCNGSMSEPIAVDDTGSFTSPFAIPNPGLIASEDACSSDGTCTTTVGGEQIRCDDVTTRCALRVDYEDGAGGMSGPPTFPAVPIPITFR
jgi:hypothetical protein